MINIKLNNNDITDGKLMKWFVKEGSKVEKGQTIAEIQQIKQTIDIVAPESGVIQKIMMPEQSSVKYNDTLAEMSSVEIVKNPIKKNINATKAKVLRTLVIGSGPGGYVAAIRAAELGQKVTIVEDTFIGGVCLNVGCIPSKSLIHAGIFYKNTVNGDRNMGISGEKNCKIDFKQTQNWKQHDVVERLTSGVEYLLKRHKVNIIRGHAILTDEHHAEITLKDNGEKQSIAFDNVILATGSHSAELSNVKFSNRVINSTSCLALKEIPHKLVIVGGGFIAAELGAAYLHLGAEVTILEHSNRILKHFDADMSSIVEQQFIKNGGKIIYNIEIKKVIEENNDKATVYYTSKDKEHQITGDYVLLAVGRHTNITNLGLEKLGVKTENHRIVVDEQGRTNIASIWAIGDIVHGKMLAHKAFYEGKVAAEAISGEHVKVDYKAIPVVAFTDPEIASTGMSFEEASDNQKYKAYKFQLSFNGRALSLDQTEGFMRLIVNATNQKIVGGQIVGASASELIGEITLAIQNELTVNELANSIHPHPTISESLIDVADDALNLPINN